MEFAYNNTKYANTGYTLFKLNYEYYLYIFYKEDVEPRSWSNTANKLTEELRNLMVLYRENLQYTQKLQKQAQNKGIKSRSYDLNKKV